MKSIKILLVILSASLSGMAQEKANNPNSENQSVMNSQSMKTYLIEREIPGAGELTEEQLKEISQKSCSVLKEMGPQIEWVHSYVTDDKVYCIYRAQSEELIRQHATRGGFPADAISELSTKISPATAR